MQHDPSFDVHFMNHCVTLDAVGVSFAVKLAVMAGCQCLAEIVRTRHLMRDQIAINAEVFQGPMESAR